MTALDRPGDSDKELLLLGPWCLLGHDSKDFSKTAFTVLPTPFPTAQTINEAAEYCRGVYRFFLEQLTVILNETHRVDFPIEYWSILIGPWLLHFTHVYYDRFCRIEMAIDKYHVFETMVLPRDKCRPVLLTTSEFIYISSTDHYYNWQLFSTICRGVCANNCIDTKFEYPEKGTLVFKPGIKRRCWSLLERISSARPVVLSEINHITAFDQLSLFSDKRFNRLGFRTFLGASQVYDRVIDSEMRSRLKLYDNGDSFSCLMARVLPDVIPFSYIEHYQRYKEMADSIRCNRMEFFGSAGGWYENEAMKYFAARAQTDHTILMDFQHGGGYGLSLSVVPEDISLEKDIFFTWGWTGSDSGYKTIPLPNPHLSRLRDRYEECGQNMILMIGTAMPPYHYRFDTGLKPDDMLEYFNSRSRFVGGLSSRIREKLAFRPYQNEYGWGDLESVMGYGPIPVVSGGQLTDWMTKAGLVVIDHPHTSYLEALSLNVPTVLYWNHDIQVMRPEAEPYFQLLRDAGILYQSPEAAAAKVNQIYLDPFKWWSGEKVQQARKEFCRRFALSSSDWKRDWAEVFKKIRTEDFRGVH